MQVPENGLVVYTGTILTDDGKEKKVNIDFEPFKPINTSLYLCDNKFHTEALQELLESDAKYGFIIMDGNGSLFGTLSGNTRNVLHKFSVDLPKKHGRGGQSALRFARLRLEKRHNYVRKVAETSVQMFVTDGQRPNVAGLVVAGSAEFKEKLLDSELFDPRLKAIVLLVCDVSYGAPASRLLQRKQYTLHQRQPLVPTISYGARRALLQRACPCLHAVVATLASELFDPRLKAIVLLVCDVSYGAPPLTWLVRPSMAMVPPGAWECDSGGGNGLGPAHESMELSMACKRRELRQPGDRAVRSNRDVLRGWRAP